MVTFWKGSLQVPHNHSIHGSFRSQFSFTALIGHHRFRRLPVLCLAAILSLGAAAPVVAGDEYVVGPQVLKEIGDRYGTLAFSRVRHWHEFMSKYRHESDIQKLHRVKAFFRRFSFLTDRQQWGRNDYWATPIELIAKSGGDCEDISVATYFTLRQMGVPSDRLRLTYVKERSKKNQGHMVLAYQQSPKSPPLVLDNLREGVQSGDVWGEVDPVYSFNSDGLWLPVGPGLARRVGGPSRLKMWRDLVVRMDSESIPLGVTRSSGRGRIETAARSVDNHSSALIGFGAKPTRDPLRKSAENSLRMAEVPAVHKSLVKRAPVVKKAPKNVTTQMIQRRRRTILLER